MPKIERQLNQVFLETEVGTNTRVGKTEDNIIEISVETEDKNYIDSPTATQEITSASMGSTFPYAAMPGDPMYDWLFENLYQLKLAVATRGIRVFQQMDETTSAYKAWEFDAKLVYTEYNQSSGLLTFTMTHENVVVGTAVMTAGNPVFTPSVLLTGATVTKQTKNKI